MKMKAVGGLIFVHDDKGPKKAVLRKRGSIERTGEFDSKPETYSGACQVTFHVKLIPAEADKDDFITALKRGAKHELGIALYEWMRKKELFENNNLRLLHRFEDKDRKIETYMISMPEKQFRDLVRTPFKKINVYVHSYDLKDIAKIHPEDRNSMHDSEIIAMFSDELEALHKGFSLA